jgi:PASTA domain-containing protein
MKDRRIWLIAVVLVLGGIVALVVLRGNEDEAAQTFAEPETLAAEPGSLEMPHLVGTAYQDAVEQALATGLFPNSFSVASAQARGTVIDQRPEPGAQVAPGATIRIDVSRGRGPEVQRQVPDLTGLGLADALRACAQSGFTCRAVPAGGPGLVVTAARPLPGGPTELAQIELSTG